MQDAFDVDGRTGDDAMFAGCIDAEFDRGAAALERFHHLIGGDCGIGMGDDLADIPRQVDVVDGAAAAYEGGCARHARGVGRPVRRAVERLHGDAVFGLGSDLGQRRAVERLLGQRLPLRLVGAREFN